jgi:hypothetical protein
MRLLDRPRTWFGLGDDTSEMKPPNIDDASQNLTRFGPSKLTKVRIKIKDDPVGKLREVDSDDTRADDKG